LCICYVPNPVNERLVLSVDLHAVHATRNIKIHCANTLLHVFTLHKLDT